MESPFQEYIEQIKEYIKELRQVHLDKIADLYEKKLNEICKDISDYEKGENEEDDKTTLTFKPDLKLEILAQINTLELDFEKKQKDKIKEQKRKIIYKKISNLENDINREPIEITFEKFDEIYEEMQALKREPIEEQIDNAKIAELTYSILITQALSEGTIDLTKIKNKTALIEVIKKDLSVRASKRFQENNIDAERAFSSMAERLDEQLLEDKMLWETITRQKDLKIITENKEQEQEQEQDKLKEKNKQDSKNEIIVKDNNTSIQKIRQTKGIIASLKEKIASLYGTLFKNFTQITYIDGSKEITKLIKIWEKSSNDLNRIEEIFINERKVSSQKTEYSIHKTLENLETVYFGDNVKEINGNWFAECPKFHKVVIGKNVEAIKTNSRGSFAHNPIKDVDFSRADKLKVIGTRSFENCNIETLALPESIQYIEPCAFNDNEIEEIVFPHNIRKICSGAFATNPIKKAKFPDGTTLTSIKNYEFEPRIETGRENTYPIDVDKNAFYFSQLEKKKLNLVWFCSDSFYKRNTKLVEDNESYNIDEVTFQKARDKNAEFRKKYRYSVNRDARSREYVEQVYQEEMEKVLKEIEEK